MKFLLASLSIALATSTLATAAPTGSAPAEAPAASNQKLDLARQFIALSNPAGDMMGVIRESALMTFAELADDPEEEAVQKEAERRVDAILARAEPTIKKRMPEVLEAYAQVYAREFSAEELEQLIIFARTPAGRHYIARMAFLDMDPAILDANQALTDELTPIMQQVTRELCAERAAQRLAAGDAKAKCPLSEEPETLAS